MSFKNKWLIKSDSKIVGPYTFEQVEDLILKKQVSILDEIKDMENRWLHIRERKDFKEIVESIRQQIDEKVELTQTMQTVSSKTFTAFNTEIISKEIEQEIVGTSKSDLTSDLKVVAKKMTLPSVHFRKEKANVQSKSWLKYILIVLIFGAASYFAGHYYMTGLKNEKSLAQQVRKYQLYLQEEKLIDAFKKMTPEIQDKVLVDLIPMWMKLEKAGAITYQREMDLISSGRVTGNDRKAQYQLVKFNKAFALADFQNAKDSLVKAFEFDSASFDVQENDAIFKFSEKKYKQSADVFKKLYLQTGLGRHLYSYILNYAYLIHSTDQAQLKIDKIELENLFQLISKHVNSRLDFSKELLLLQIYLIKKANIQGTDIDLSALSLINEMPIRFNQFFRHPYLVNEELVKWTVLMPFVQELVASLDSTKADIYNIHYNLEIGNTSRAAEILNKSTTLSISEKNNFSIYLKILKVPNVEIETGFVDFNLSSKVHQALDLENKDKDMKLSKAAWNNLMQEKGLIGQWSKIKSLDLSKDQIQIKNLIQSDKVNENEFLPYIKLKALLNE